MDSVCFFGLQAVMSRSSTQSTAPSLRKSKRKRGARPEIRSSRATSCTMSQPVACSVRSVGGKRKGNLKIRARDIVVKGLVSGDYPIVQNPSSLSRNDQEDKPLPRLDNSRTLQPDPLPLSPPLDTNEENDHRPRTKRPGHPRLGGPSMSSSDSNHCHPG